MAMTRREPSLQINIAIQSFQRYNTMHNIHTNTKSTTHVIHISKYKAIHNNDDNDYGEPSLLKRPDKHCNTMYVLQCTIDAFFYISVHCSVRTAHYIALH